MKTFWMGLCTLMIAALPFAVVAPITFASDQETEITIERSAPAPAETPAPVASGKDEETTQTPVAAPTETPEPVKEVRSRPVQLIPVGSPITRFDIKDVNGRLIYASQLEDWIVVYGFGNEDSADLALKWLKNISIEVPHARGILFVIVADTTKFNNKLLRPFVKKKLKSEYKKQLRLLEEAFAERNIEPDYNMENRYMLIADMKADVYRLFGLSNYRDSPHLIIVDGNHKVKGHFTEYSDEIVTTLQESIAERDAEQQKQYALQIKKKKKNMLKRYAIAGAVLYLVFR